MKKSDNNKKDNNNNNKRPDDNVIAIAVVVGLLAIVLLLPKITGEKSQKNTKELNYSEFLVMVDNKNVSDVNVYPDGTIDGKLLNAADFTKFKTKIPYIDLEFINRLKNNSINFKYGSKADVGGMVYNFLPLIIMIAFFVFMSRKMGGGAFGKNKSKRYEEEKNGAKITFADVAGQAEAKADLKEVVEFLKNPTHFEEIGARIPRGVLLIGSPGTGKTLLARAVAGEAEVPFFLISGSDFVELYVGVGASRVRNLFEEARKNAPAIIFIDEIDAVGRSRGNSMHGGHDEREQTLNQMLVEMDGFSNRSGVIVMAATNRADVLDSALLRPGRFDRQVTIALPDQQERTAILKLHAKNVKMASDISYETIAKSTSGASGADLANIINESALYAARLGHKEVSQHDLEEAVDKALMGNARKSSVIPEKERLATAYHEAGHSLLHYYLPYSDKLHKVTIIPRGQALGLTYSLPESDITSMHKKQLLDRIKILFGGYVAENIIYNYTTTGTAQDLKQATAIARRMVGEWGMGTKTGITAWSSQLQDSLWGQVSPYSNQSSVLMDEDVNNILNEALADVNKILNEHKDQLEKLANALVEKETLNDAEIRVLLDITS